MRRLGGVSILLSALAISALAQDPNQQRGFSPGRLYDLLGIDSVGVFNGNMSMRIPLGQTYSVGPNLTYQFMLAYNSKVWDFEYVELHLPRDPSVHRRRAIPERRSNAGLGWRLTLGELFPPESWTHTTPDRGTVYVAPDGAEHEFNARSSNGNGHMYTTDGSYLRMRTLAPNSSGQVHYEIDFPDGVIRTFNHLYQLIKIADRLGNWVLIDRQSTTLWVITDGHGDSLAARTHTIQFVGSAVDYQPNFQYVPTKLTLAAFNGGSAEYDFTYQDAKIQRGTCADEEVNDPKTVDVRFLKEIALPDGSKYTPSYQPTDNVACTAGVIEELKLPTGGSIAWEHGQYEMSNSKCIPVSPEEGDGWRSDYAGIRSRTLKNEHGDPIQRRVYTPELVHRARIDQRCGNSPQIFDSFEEPPEDFINTITVFDGGGAILEKTVHYFSAFPLEANGTLTDYARSEEYGLPLTRKFASGSRYLSTEIYPCVNNACSTTPDRKSYVSYAGGLPPGVAAAKPPLRALPNARVEGERQVFNDAACPGGCYTDTAHSDYDHYGHFRKSIRTSNFPGAVETTTYQGYTPNPTTWLLNLYDQSWVKQGSGTSAVATKSIATFDPDRGVLTSVRTLRAKGSDPATLPLSAADLLTARCRHKPPFDTQAGSRGFLDSERYFGGDVSPIPPGDPCVASRVDGAYIVDHMYDITGSAVTGHTARYRGTSHLIADETFDVNTGFVAKGRDSAERETTYLFDTSGRLTASRGALTAWTSYDYAATAVPPAVTVRQCPSGAASCITGALTEARYYYDALGRLDQERKRIPGGWSATWTEYDALGRKKTTSVPTGRPDGDPGAKPDGTAVTAWEYDALGRVTREILPDQTYRLAQYTGVREVKYLSGREGTAPIPAAERSKEVYDDADRLLRVEQTPQPGGTVVASYTYDTGGRLATVSMQNAAGSIQNRIFDYDGAGFLRWESHPESGMSSYTYDAKGHVASRNQSAAQSQFDLRYKYDAAERIVQLHGRNPYHVPGNPLQPEFRILKEFGYGNDNTATDFRKGKLVSAARFNYGPLSGSENVYRITDGYAYEDAAGRKTTRTTIIDRMDPEWGPTELKNIVFRVAYDALGLPTTMQYPMCRNCGGPVRTSMTRAYDQGRLTAIPGIVGNISYWPNGMRHVLSHSNGVADTQDVGNMSRPTAIAFATQGSCQRPAFLLQPRGGSITGSGSFNLSVTASGTGPLRYEWYNVRGEYIGATSSITVSPAQTTTYYVAVSNSCGFERSQDVTVTVNAPCQLPSTGAIAAILQPDGAFILTPDPVIGQSPVFSWKRLSDGALLGSSTTLVVPAPSSTTTYSLTITDSCGTVTSHVTLKVPLSITAIVLLARAVSTNRIELSWSAVAGATAYLVERRSGALWEAPVQVSTSAYVDTTVQPSRSYAYRVYAAGGGSESQYSNSALATTRNFTKAVPGQNVSTSPGQDMLAAVNSVRAAVGWPPVTWSNILAATDPVPAPGNVVVARHVMSTRARMNEALQALGVPAAPYGTPNLVGAVISASHINEVQDRARPVGVQ